MSTILARCTSKACNAKAADVQLKAQHAGHAHVLQLHRWHAHPWLLPHAFDSQIDMRHEAVLQEEERLVVVRFGRDADAVCMQMDEVLASVADPMKNFAVIYLVDILPRAQPPHRVWLQMLRIMVDCCTQQYQSRKCNAALFGRHQVRRCCRRLTAVCSFCSSNASGNLSMLPASTTAQFSTVSHLRPLVDRLTRACRM